MKDDGARSNRDPAVVAAKLARLSEPHIAPITALVDRIRALRQDKSVPYVDPTLGGVNARVLFLLETPARAAALNSTMLSPDNDDGTAENVWKLYQASGLRRDMALHWNAVPWFMGDERKNKNARLADVRGGVSSLAELIGLLPRLRLVITMGEIARRSFALYLLEPDARIVPWLAVAHPSDRVRNTNKDLWEGDQRAFAMAAEIVRAGPP